MSQVLRMMITPHCTLHPNHQKDLEASGLSKETIAEAGIYTETDHRRIAAMLNRDSYSRKYGPALVFPFHDETGAVVLQRVKPDYPAKQDGKPAAKYLSPTGAPVRAYIPPRVHDMLAAEPTRTVLITEGEKKALMGTQEGFPTIGLTGVDCWHTKKSSALIPDLARIEWKGRKAFIVFDSDAAKNENVQVNESLLGHALKNHGAEVRVVRLPAGPNGEKVGLDDYLLSNTPDGLRRLLDQAEEPELPEPDEVKQPASGLHPEVAAERFLNTTRRNNHSRLVWWREIFWYWSKGCYRERPESEVRSQVTRFLNLHYFKVGKQAVTNVLDQVKAQSILSSQIDPPAWLEAVPGSDWPPHELLLTKNKIIHLSSLFAGGEFTTKPTPALFNTTALDFDFVESEGCAHPDRWLEFLDELWGEDAEAVEALQLWFGYCLAADTSQQKMLGLPSRSTASTCRR